MRRRFALFLVLPAFALVPLLVVAFGGCSNQGEGERCSKTAGNGGNDDCQSGLECNATVDPRGPRCCPHDLSTAKTAACAITGTADANLSVPDTSTAIDTSTEAMSTRSDALADGNADGAADAPGEALSETGLDAPADAAADGAATGDGSDATIE